MSGAVIPISAPEHPGGNIRFQPRGTGGGAHICVEKEKGRDLGYALAASSCEGVDSVESCTITAFDVITAFAVPNPGHVLAEQPVFSGQVAHRVAPAGGLPSLLRTG